MSFSRVAWVLLLAVLATACARETTVTAAFSDPRDLDVGVPVYLGETQVGEVAGLTLAGGYTEAELSLDPGRVAGLRTGSAALLAMRNGRTAVELYNYRPGAEPLESGDELTALNNSMEYAAWQAGEAMESGRQSLDDMTTAIGDYFNSEEWRRQKERMDRQLADLEEQMGRAYEETSRAYEELMRNLESESEAARRRAEESYAELARRIREQMAELRAQGNEKILAPLQRLLEELSRAMEKKPEQREV